MSLKNKSVNNQVLEETISISIFVTNNDFDLNIKKEETLNEQMNKIFTKYSDIKIKLNNLRKNSIR